MRLTLQTDYALRLLMHLAVNAPELVTISDVAARYGISKNHLMKVAHALGREGFIETVRGRGGGLRLQRPANAVNVGRVVRTLEASTALVECFPNGNGACLISPACKLKGALLLAQNAFFEVLDGYSVEDLTAGNAALVGLLSEDIAA